MGSAYSRWFDIHDAFDPECLYVTSPVRTAIILLRDERITRRSLVPVSGLAHLRTIPTWTLRARRKLLQSSVFD